MWQMKGVGVADERSGCGQAERRENVDLLDAESVW